MNQGCRLMYLMFIALFCAAEDRGGIRGSVVDATGKGLPNSRVRVMPVRDGVTIYRTISAADGSFQLDGVIPGTYRIAASLAGFRERFSPEFPVDAKRNIDVETLKLDFAGCESPTVTCHSFMMASRAGSSRSSRFIELPFGSAVNLDSGGLSRHATKNSDVDLQLRTDGQIYLRPHNGTLLAQPNSAKVDCQDAVMTGQPIRIDGLGMGSDICLRTSEDARVLVMFTREVSGTEGAVGFRYVRQRAAR